MREIQADTDRHTEIETDNYTETEKDRETERRRDRGRDRQTDRPRIRDKERESACQNDKEKKYCIVGFGSTLTNPELRQLVLFQANHKSNSSKRYSKATTGFYD